MTPESRAIVQAVACEVIAATASAPPPPADTASERLVIAGLLCDACPEDTDLRREDFSSPLLGAVYEMACLLRAEGLQVAIEPILVALKEQGWMGAVEEELLHVRDEVPSVARLDLEAAAQTIVEMAERRRVLALCERVAVRLRSGACDSTDAITELEEVRSAS